MKKRKLILPIVALLIGASFATSTLPKIVFQNTVKNAKVIKNTADYIANFVQNKANNNYGSTYNVSCNGIDWNIPGNQAIDNYVKIGGKLSKATDRTLKTTEKLDYEIGQIVIDHGAKDSQITVNSLTLNAYTPNQSGEPNTEPLYTKTANYTASGNSIFTISTSEAQTGLFYEFVYNLSSSAPSSNKGLIINSISFYSYEKASDTAKTVTFNDGTNTIGWASVEENGKLLETDLPTRRGYTASLYRNYSNGNYSNPFNYTTTEITADITLYVDWVKVDITEDYLTEAMVDSTDYRIIGKILVKKNDGEVYIYNGTNNMKLVGSSNFSGLNVGDVIDVYGTYDKSNEQLHNFAYIDKINEEVTTPTPLTSVNDINSQHLYEYVSLSYLQLNANLSNSTAIKGQDFILYYSNYSCVSGYKANTYFANNYVNVTGVILQYNNEIEIMISSIELSTLATVTFETFDGTVIDSVEIVPGSIITRPSTTPTKESDVYWVYTFENWYDDPNCNEDNFTGDPFNFNTPITENTTLYARYTKEANTAVIDMISTFETKRSLTYKYDYTVTETGDGNIDFDASKQGYENAEDITSIQFAPGLTAILALGTNSNNNSPKYYTNDSTIRCYTGNTLTISNANGNISSITFTFTTKGSWSANEGTLSNSNSNETWTWTGDASTIVFTNTANSRITNISIVYEKDIKDFNFYNTAIRFGGLISKEYWNAINTQGVVTDYGIMLSSEQNLNSLSVNTIEEAFEADPSNVTIRSNGNANAPQALNEDYYLFNAKITFPNDSLFTRNFHAVAYMVVDGDYKFFAESNCSVKSLAQEYLDDNTLPYNEDSFDGSLAALAAFGE